MRGLWIVAFALPGLVGGCAPHTAEPAETVAEPKLYLLPQEDLNKNDNEWPDVDMS